MIAPVQRLYRPTGMKCPRCRSINPADRERCVSPLCNHPFEPWPRSKDLLQGIEGWASGVNCEFFTPCIRGPWLDADGYERASRINGSVECPGCCLMWPIVEEPDEWTESGHGWWIATSYGPGAAECLHCHRIFVDAGDEILELFLKDENEHSDSTSQK